MQRKSFRLLTLFILLTLLSSLVSTGLRTGSHAPGPANGSPSKSSSSPAMKQKTRQPEARHSTPAFRFVNVRAGMSMLQQSQAQRHRQPRRMPCPAPTSWCWATLPPAAITTTSPSPANAGDRVYTAAHDPILQCFRPTRGSMSSPATARHRWSSTTTTAPSPASRRPLPARLSQQLEHALRTPTDSAPLPSLRPITCMCGCKVVYPPLRVSPTKRRSMPILWLPPAG